MSFTRREKQLILKALDFLYFDNVQKVDIWQMELECTKSRSARYGELKERLAPLDREQRDIGTITEKLFKVVT